ncbi:MAG: TonB C-terminal domain-containing protein [Chitinispirillales bacterium]|jgi:TonB family protein|nr:TonB C-terminal domain-containing protein [Chitinispirillales bacterium]
MEYASVQTGERPVYGDVGFRKVLIVSVACHVLLLIVLPFVSTLFVKPKKVERPKTFQLVTAAPVPPAPQRKVPNEPTPPPPDPTPPPPKPPEPKPTPVPTPAPKPPEPTPAPKTEPAPAPKPEPKPERVSKPVEENIDDLASLLEGLPQPRAQISAVGVKQDEYLRGVVNKIERNWAPSVENSRISVVIGFTIEHDGNASGIRVTTSSGDGTVDREGLNAVTRASPFGKLPPHYAGDKVEINITLYPTRRR